MFEVAYPLICHEATHLARMDLFGTDESHEPDIDDISYLSSDAELNAFAIQSIMSKEDEDLAAELYDSYDDLLEIFEETKSQVSENLITDDEPLNSLEGNESTLPF